jgi:hypothetical protein
VRKAIGAVCELRGAVKGALKSVKVDEAGLLWVYARSHCSHPDLEMKKESSSTAQGRYDTAKRTRDDKGGNNSQ